MASIHTVRGYIEVFVLGRGHSTPKLFGFANFGGR